MLSLHKHLGWLLCSTLILAVAAATPTRQRGATQKAVAVAANFTNPVLDQDFPDPTVIRAPDGWYYAYGTQGAREGKSINIQVARSKDLVRWEHLGDALPVKPAWANQTQNFWAPHVSRVGKAYYMYYSADPNAKTGLCLAVARAKSPAGPFTDIGHPLKCGESFINIDPMQFDDPRTGKRLLYWGSGFKPIKVQELAPDYISFMPGSEPKELVFPINDEDPNNYQRLVEGAWVIYRKGYYYLFFSGDNCCGEKAHYGVMVARARNAFGPFETLAAANRKKNSVILERSARWLAPGHNSIVTDRAGDDWIVYHAIDVNHPRATPESEINSRRVMLIDRVTYRDGWPVIGDGTASSGEQSAPRAR
ncbi:MAG TPA: glycoside hydrolase family 43 protein [Pyrinomonadaceae bacterium]|jgi:arabinan endo-1,5-alpha-L-arabinosidase